RGLGPTSSGSTRLMPATVTCTEALWAAAFLSGATRMASNFTMPPPMDDSVLDSIAMGAEGLALYWACACNRNASSEAQKLKIKTESFISFFLIGHPCNNYY